MFLYFSLDNILDQEIISYIKILLGLQFITCNLLFKSLVSNISKESYLAHDDFIKSQISTGSSLDFIKIYLLAQDIIVCVMIPLISIGRAMRVGLCPGVSCKHPGFI